MAALLTIVIAVAVSVRQDFTLSDRLAAVNAVFAGAAVVLALVGGGIALQSFKSSTGSPEIQVQVWFAGDSANALSVVAESDGDGRLRSINVGGHARLRVRLKNTSQFDASNLLVNVRLEGLFFDQEVGASAGEWRIVDAVEGKGAMGAEWSGNSLLHAESTRRLPDLDMRRILAVPELGPYNLQLYVAAAGYTTKKHCLPVRVIVASRQGVKVLKPIAIPEWL